MTTKYVYVIAYLWMSLYEGREESPKRQWACVKSTAGTNYSAFLRSGYVQQLRPIASI